MTNVNIALLLTATGLFLVGFGRKLVADPDGGSFLRRVQVAGWLSLAFYGFGLGLGIYKEEHSFEGQSRALYPKFADLVDGVTGHSPDEWTRYFSYRMTLRLLAQKAYKKTFHREPLPESMRAALRRLGQAGAVNDGLCLRLDYLRYHTYWTEWGALGAPPSDAQLANVGADAEKGLKEFSKRIDDMDLLGLKANPQTVCGNDPPDAQRVSPAAPAQP